MFLSELGNSGSSVFLNGPAFDFLAQAPRTTWLPGNPGLPGPARSATLRIGTFTCWSQASTKAVRGPVSNKHGSDWQASQPTRSAMYCIMLRMPICNLHCQHTYIEVPTSFRPVKYNPFSFILPNYPVLAIPRLRGEFSNCSVLSLLLASLMFGRR